MEYLSLIGDGRIIIFIAWSSVFSDSSCFGKIFENPESNDAWEKAKIRMDEFFFKNYRYFDRIDGEPMEFEWNIFQGFQYVAVLRQSQPDNFTGRILFMSMFNDISCGTKDIEKECLANVPLVCLYAKRFGKGQWLFNGPWEKVVLYHWR